MLFAKEIVLIVVCLLVVTRCCFDMSNNPKVESECRAVILNVISTSNFWGKEVTTSLKILDNGKEKFITKDGNLGFKGDTITVKKTTIIRQDSLLNSVSYE